MGEEQVEFAEVGNSDGGEAGSLVEGDSDEELSEALEQADQDINSRCR